MYGFRCLPNSSNITDVTLLSPPKMLLPADFPRCPLLLDKEFHSSPCYRTLARRGGYLTQAPCTPRMLFTTLYLISGEYKKRRLDRLAGEGRLLPVDKAQALAGVPYGQKSKALPSSALARSNLLRQGPDMDQ